MKKIVYKTPIVEMQGDEMTRILWDYIKDILIMPYVELNVDYYDLGLMSRDESDDLVTVRAAEAIKKYGVGVKCATITPNAQRMSEYKLKKMWLSPNGTIRAMLDGTVFRTPIIAKNVTAFIPTWTKPITIARHAYGDVYKNSEIRVDGEAECSLEVKYSSGKIERKPIASMSSGVIQGIHNTDKSISSFARSVFNYALEVGQDVWFATKDTISKTYDARFKDIFAEIFSSEYSQKFASRGLNYEYTLIDDSVARIIRSNGGMIWALKNYDGDVMSDMVATCYGSLAMMSSVLVSPDGNFEYEAAHGTVTKHYYKHLNGEETSTNSVATIFAWTGALKKRGATDGVDELVSFATKLEKATLDTIEAGFVTGDLVALIKTGNVVKLSSKAFLEKIAENLAKEMA